MSIISKILKTSILGGVVALMMTTSSVAGGSLEAPKSACSASANVAITTDYVFRGVSQADEDVATQGGFDLTCGIFYAGIWGSSVDFGDDTSAEVDFYAGITPSYKGLNFDLGVIYYAYDDDTDINVFELKAGVSGDVAGLGLGATGYFNIDDEVYTYELSAEKGFSAVGPFTPTVSALVGFVDADGGDYTYWNAGVSLGFAEKFALDLRYHDTDVDTSLTDERFVATLSASF